MSVQKTLNRLELSSRARCSPRSGCLGLHSSGGSRVIESFSKLGIDMMSHSKNSLDAFGCEISPRFERLPVEPDVSRPFLGHCQTMSIRIRLVESRRLKTDLFQTC